ncbi:tetratricopeptide repeat protein [Neoroseomonas oryzicola]|uniref:tetratricopeptide repeat protein n=1 Tax=Neoroseomonas oryzicola TaxID=535904 RepID=UPI001BA5CBEA
MRRDAAGGPGPRPRAIRRILRICLLLAAAPASAQAPVQESACEDVQPGPPAHAAEAACSFLLDNDIPAGPAERARILVNRGVARTLTGAIDGAGADFDAAVALDPANLHARSNRAAMAVGRGDHEAALADLDAVIAANPDFPLAQLSRARVRRALGDRDGARSDLDAAIEAAPMLFEHYALRGDLRREEADVGGAMADYEAALRRQPVNAYVRTNRAVLLFHIGARRQAAEEIERALDEAPPGDPWPLAASAGLALLAGDIGRAEAELAAALERAPRDAMALHLRAILRARLGDGQGSRADAAAARAGQPDIAQAAEIVFGLGPP